MNHPASPSRRRFTLLAAATAATAATAFTGMASAADAYPNHPIRLLVGFSAGGAVDIVARQLSFALTPKLGQSIVVENKPGATGTIAAEAAAKAAPDGYTLLLATQSTMVVAPGLFPKSSFSPLKDFIPVSLVASVPMVLVTNPSTPANNLKELIDLARSKNGGLAYASSGSGGPQHVASELLASMANVKMTHIPYKGEANAINDLLGNQVPLMFGNLPTLLPYIKAKKVRAIAVSSLHRAETAPDIPTIDESGLKGFEALTWFGVFAPAGTPRPVIDRLHANLVQSLADPEFKGKLKAQGLTLVGNTPEQFRAYMQTESVKWAKLIENAHIKPE
ncbi:MAG: LacI family transcriptional regulator [Herminiimonas sp.]|nr:LacI family transcriptional regulator [Herminiimonas sp.]